MFQGADLRGVAGVITITYQISHGVEGSEAG